MATLHLCIDNFVLQRHNETFLMQIEEVAGPVILDWIIAQHSRVLQWTERAVDLEVEWIIQNHHNLFRPYGLA